MELLNFASFTTTTWIFLIFILFLSLITIKSNKSKPQNLPPGPWKLPIIGSMHKIILTTSPAHRSLAKLAKKYGPIIHLKFGETLVVVVSSAELAKSIMKTHDLSFVDRPSSLATDVIFLNKSVAFSPYTDHFRQMKNICIFELLSTKKVKSYHSIREKEVSKLISLIENQVGTAINLSAQLLPLSSSIMCWALFGENLVHGEGEIIDLGIVGEAISLMDWFDLTNSFPSLKIIASFTGMNTKLFNFRKKVDKIFGGIIRKRKEYVAEMKKRGGERENDCLLSNLLRLQEEDELEFPITDDTIKAVLLDMFLAGSESSAIIVEWAMSELIKNPKIMEKAQSLVRQNLDENKINKTSNAPTPSYINLIIKETIRLHPLGPLLVPRECRETCEINGYTIPFKSKVLINAWAIARDLEFWDDAEKFIPERFENIVVDYKGNNFEFIPFGSGRRMCPGISFGVATVELALTQLLYHFNWKLPNDAKGEELDMYETSGIAAARKNPLHVIATLNC